MSEQEQPIDANPSVPQPIGNGHASPSGEAK